MCLNSPQYGGDNCVRPCGTATLLLPLPRQETAALRWQLVLPLCSCGWTFRHPDEKTMRFGRANWCYQWNGATLMAKRRCQTRYNNQSSLFTTSGAITISSHSSTKCGSQKMMDSTHLSTEIINGPRCQTTLMLPVQSKALLHWDACWCTHSHVLLLQINLQTSWCEGKDTQTSQVKLPMIKRASLG